MSNNTFRQNLYPQIKTDLLKITVANGYSHDVNPDNLRQGFVPISNIAGLISYYLGEETREAIDELGTFFNKSSKIYFLIHIKTVNDNFDAQIISNECESWIKDIELFFALADKTKRLNYENIKNYDGNYSAQRPSLPVSQPIFTETGDYYLLLVEAGITYSESL